MVICPVEIFWAQASRPGRKVGGMEGDDEMEVFDEFFVFLGRKGEDIHLYKLDLFLQVLMEMLSNQNAFMLLFKSYSPSQDVFE